MLHNIKPLPLHCVFHGIRVKVNEDWESGKIPFFYAFPEAGPLSGLLNPHNRSMDYFKSDRYEIRPNNP